MLERDEQGFRTGFKCQIKVKRPMSQDGWDRWGTKQKTKIAKHKFIYPVYSSSKAVGLNNGIPVELMKKDHLLIPYLIDKFQLSNETYYLHGYAKGKTKSKPKLTKATLIIQIHDPQNYKYTIIKNNLNRYFFRQKPRTKNTKPTY